MEKVSTRTLTDKTVHNIIIALSYTCMHTIYPGARDIPIWDTIEQLCCTVIIITSYFCTGTARFEISLFITLWIETVVFTNAHRGIGRFTRIIPTRGYETRTCNMISARYRKYHAKIQETRAVSRTIFLVHLPVSAVCDCKLRRRANTAAANAVASAALCVG